MNCFFCCKILPKEENCHSNDDDGDHLKDFSEYSETTDTCDNSTINGVVNKPGLMQISHYLQIPKTLITKLEETASQFIFCKECEYIREKLEELCGLLEVTQMKINYHLNLLTDQILQKDDQPDHQQTNISKFQETFYNKCLSKLAKTDLDPVLQLTKCSTHPENNDTEVCMEEPANFEAQVTKLEEQDNQDEQLIELDVQDDPDYQYDALDEQDNQDDHYHTLDEPDYDPFTIQMNKLKRTNFPCGQCPLVFNNAKNQQSHIETVHVKQKTSAGHLIKACEYCGAMISSRNLSQHKKRMHGMGQLRNYEKCACGIFIRDNNLIAHKLICRKINQKKPVECDICGNMISYTNIKAHKKKVHGIMSDNGLASEMVMGEDPLE